MNFKSRREIEETSEKQINEISLNFWHDQKRFSLNKRNNILRKKKNLIFFSFSQDFYLGSNLVNFSENDLRKKK